MVKKMYQNPSGGLNEAGRKYFNRTEGSNLKAPVKSGTNPRRRVEESRGLPDADYA